MSPNFLVTAGHNVAGVRYPVKEIRITYPGVDVISSLDVAQGKVSTISCKLLGTLYKRNRGASKDIAILDAGSFNAPFHLTLSSALPPVDGIVDVIGYPDEIKREWVETHQGAGDLGNCQKQAIAMFPKGNLFVTRGLVRASGDTISYKLSTCPGLSGSCLLYKGTAVG